MSVHTMLWLYFMFQRRLFFSIQQTWSTCHTATPLITPCADVKKGTNAKSSHANSVCPYQPQPDVVPLWSLQVGHTLCCCVTWLVRFCPDCFLTSNQIHHTFVKTLHQFISISGGCGDLIPESQNTEYWIVHSQSVQGTRGFHFFLARYSLNKFIFSNLI